MADARDTLCCSFCGKTKQQVRRLVAGPNGVFICDARVVLASQIIAKEQEAKVSPGR